MGVEASQVRAGPDHLDMAGSGLEQVKQRGRRLYAHLCAQRPNQGGIPKKLDGVAKTLFTVQQDRFARHRCLTQPQRLRKVGWTQAGLGVAPTPLVQRPALAEITLGQQRQRFVPVGIRVVRQQADAGIKAGNRSVHLAQVLQRKTSVTMKFSRMGVDGDGSVVAGQRGSRVWRAQARLYQMPSWLGAKASAWS